jgi:sulfur carrier protein ThiS adenylyltransferase
MFVSVILLQKRYEMQFHEINRLLKKRTVGIAGCGGLGSNCAVALARVGVGSFVIADFDVVIEDNLSRQYYFMHQIGLLKVFALKQNLQLINSEVKVHAFDIKLCPSDIVELFGNCDVIVEAFDKPEMKYMIMETVHNFLPDKFLVMGIGMAGWGENNSIRTQFSDKLIICGDQKNEVSAENPPLAPRVGIVANMQANMVLEILLGKNPHGYLES